MPDQDRLWRASLSEQNAHNVVEALVYTLYDSCDAARDLYQTLKIKEKRDYEQSLRSKGYPSSRRIEFVDDESFGKDANFALEKVAITQQFEVGYRKYGEQFLVGDCTFGTKCGLVLR